MAIAVTAHWVPSVGQVKMAVHLCKTAFQVATTEITVRFLLCMNIIYALRVERVKRVARVKFLFSNLLTPQDQRTFMVLENNLRELLAISLLHADQPHTSLQTNQSWR